MSNKAIPEALARHLTSGRAERALTVERSAIDEAARTATVAFASESPYERYWGIEILDTTATSMRQGRLRSGANLLCDHDSRDVVGVVESVEVGSDRVARALVRFGKSARAEEVWQDVRDGIRRNVSVGYIVHQAELSGKREGLDVYRITDWEPFEVSLVSVPADASVGVGRALDAVPAIEREPPQTPANPEPSTPPIESPKETRTMSEVNTQAAAGPRIEVVEQRNHAAEISKIAATMPGGADLALRSIQAGHTVEQFQVEAIRALSNKPIATADIGMDKKEVKRYSLMRAINAMHNPADANAMRSAAFEFECSQAMAEKMGRAPQGFYVPFDVMAAKRDLTVASAASAGNLKETTLETTSFIELLRARTVMGSLGMTYLTGLVGDIDIPRQTGTSTFAWLAEQGNTTGSNQTTDKVNMTPKTVGARTVISRKLRQQASLDVEAWVMDDLNRQLAIEMEAAIINGSGGANQPRGILNTVGIGSVAGGANGLAPTWAHIVSLETQVSIANADVDSMAYVTNAKVRGQLKNTSRVSGQNGFIWDGGTTPLNGYGAAVTNLVPANLVKGTSGANCSAIIFGNFRDVIVGMWGGLDMLVNPYISGDNGDVSIRVLQDMDVALRHPESIAAMRDALTPAA
jgi:HK97 family phage major capsid protein/HK97 family phage prohead protease